MRGHDHQLTYEHDTGNWRLSPLPHPWWLHSAHPSHGGSCFQARSVERVCVVETIWMLYVTGPSSGLYINFKILAGRYGDVHILGPPKTNLVRKSPCLLKLSPANLEWLSLSLVSPCLPCMGPNFKFYLGNFWGCKPALKLRQVLSDSILRKKVFCSACLLSCLIPRSFNGI